MVPRYSFDSFLKFLSLNGKKSKTRTQIDVLFNHNLLIVIYYLYKHSVTFLFYFFIIRMETIK